MDAEVCSGTSDSEWVHDPQWFCRRRVNIVTTEAQHCVAFACKKRKEKSFFKFIDIEFLDLLF